MIVKPSGSYVWSSSSNQEEQCVAAGSRDLGTLLLAVTRCPRPQQPHTNYIITSSSSYHNKFGSSLRSDRACAFFGNMQ